MITRRVANQQLADKLQLTLLELKTAKEFSSQLLSERADSEKELVAVLDSNNKLKKELCLLEKQFNDINSERARLQESVDRFSECSATYEQALKDINSLERALHDAHEQIYELQEAKDNATAGHTQSLFEELVGPVSQLLIAPIENPVVSADNADLTNDSTTSRLVHCSSNKLKKYIKLNRFIKKSQKLSKHNKLFFKKLKFCKINQNLVDELDMLSVQLKNSELEYETDTQLLKLKIKNLEESIQSLEYINESSKKTLSEYSLAMDDLISQIKYNSDRFESLTRTSDQSCLCKHVNDHLSTGGRSPTMCVSSTSHIPNVVMYCDEIGRNMGTFLNYYQKGLSTISNCLPYSGLDSFSTLILNDSNINKKTTLLIFIGNRGNMNKTSLVNFLDKLNTLTVKEIIMFTLPYCNKMSESENKTRYNLNISLYNLCTYNSKFSIIDTNTYVKNYQVFLTKGMCYLSNYYKRQIALSLSYLFDISAKNLANNCASIEQSKLEMVPIITNNLN